MYMDQMTEKGFAEARENAHLTGHWKYENYQVESHLKIIFTCTDYWERMSLRRDEDTIICMFRN